MVAMLELLFAMLKEEYRIHTTLFDKRFFLVFPVVVGFISYLCCMFALRFFVDVYAVPVVGSLLFFVYGVSVGVFGLHARDALNIRFDRLSLLLYSSRTLPLSSNVVLLTFAVQDMIYYFFLTILPVVLGVAFALPSLNVVLVLLAFSLIFFYGVSVSFLLTMLYSRFGKSFLFFAGVIGFFVFVFREVWFNAARAYAFLPVGIAFEFNLRLFMALLAVPVFIVLVSVGMLENEPGTGKRRSTNLFEPVCGFVRSVSGKFCMFVAKDLVDMHRTTGGMSKIIFTYFIPAALVWVMMDMFSRIFFAFNCTLMTFAVVVGVISTGIYNWLNQYDSFANYRILPVSVRSVVVSKVVSFAIISSVSSVLILFSVAFGTGVLSMFWISLLLMFSVSFYVLSVLVYVAGLEPNVVLYDARAFVRYFAYCMPVLVPLMTASFFGAEAYGFVAVMCVGVLFLARAVFFWALEKSDDVS